jgi:hypothetical protein
MGIMDLDPKLLGFIVFVGTVVVLLIVIGAVRAGWRAGRILINLDEQLMDARRVKADEPKRDTASDDLARFIEAHYEAPKRN